MQASEIKAAPYNPRTITEDERLALSHSISRFGDISGITWNKTTGNLVTGHQRWQELKDKYKEITFYELTKNNYQIKGDDKLTTFKVRVVEWDEDKERLANVTANSHTISGKYDLNLLPTLLEEISLVDKQELRLDVLEKDLHLNFDWNSDMDEPGGKENLDGILANIKVSCEQDDKDTVKDKILTAIKDMDGVTVV